MRNRFIPLLRNEIAKMARRRLPRFGLFIISAISVLAYFAAGRIGNAASANAWGYVGFAMQIIFSDIGPVLVIAFAARLMAEETGTGAIRSILAAPVQRWELYLAKAAIGFLYMMALSTTALLCSVGLSLIHYHFGEVTDAGGTVYTGQQALRGLLAAWVLGWIPLGALTAYGLLISTIVRNTGAAVAVGISSLFLIDFTKHLAGIDAYIFTRYIDYPWQVVQQIAQGMDYQWFPEVWHLLILCGLSAALCFLAGLGIFARQELNH